MDSNLSVNKEKTSLKQKIDNIKNNRKFANDRRRWITNGKNLLISLLYPISICLNAINKDSDIKTV